MTLRSVDAAGRVAWIEEPDDVARLFVAAGGRVLLELGLATGDTTDWGYEGCSVGYLHWYGDRVVAIAVEAKHTVVWSVAVPPAGGARVPDGVERLRIDRPYVVDGDLVVWAGDGPGLLNAAALPSLAPRTPLPLRGTPIHLRLTLEAGTRLRVTTTHAHASNDVDLLALPTAAQRSFPDGADDFLERVARQLFEPRAVPLPARLLIEAVALPFCIDRQRQSVWRPSPMWLPVYWHRHLVANGDEVPARELLALFDAIAAPLPASDPERGWDPTWPFLDGAVALAVRHVRRQAGVQAEACRKGELPVGWWCLLFHPQVGSDEPGSRVDPAALTPALRRIFEILAPTRPAEIPHQYG